MKKFIIDLFSESSNISAMRVMCMLCCLTGCYLAVKDPSNIGIVSILLGSAFGGKVFQKKEEKSE